MNDSTPRIVSVALLQPAAELLAQEPMAYYREDMRGPDNWDTMPLYLTEFASGSNLKPTMTGGPIVLRYQDRNCPIELPGGRQFMAGLEGPVVGRISMVFPMEPMTLAEARQMVAQIVGQFDRGWPRVGKVREGLTEGISARMPERKSRLSGDGGSAETARPRSISRSGITIRQPAAASPRPPP